MLEVTQLQNNAGATHSACFSNFVNRLPNRNTVIQAVALTVIAVAFYVSRVPLLQKIVIGGIAAVSVATYKLAQIFVRCFREAMRINPRTTIAKAILVIAALGAVYLAPVSVVVPLNGKVAVAGITASVYLLSRLFSHCCLRSAFDKVNPNSTFARVKSIIQAYYPDYKFANTNIPTTQNLITALNNQEGDCPIFSWQNGDMACFSIRTFKKSSKDAGYDLFSYNPHANLPTGEKPSVKGALGDGMLRNIKKPNDVLLNLGTLFSCGELTLDGETYYINKNRLPE